MGMFYGHNQPLIEAPEEVTNGYLYNWDATDHVNFAPTDWRISAESDFTTLSNYLGSTNAASQASTDATLWTDGALDSDPGFGTSSFKAIPSGRRSATDGTFSTFGNAVWFWCANGNSDNGNYSYFHYNTTSIFDDNLGSKKWGFSARLIYNGTGAPSSSTLTDYDGNVYNIIQIGTQYWLDRNWKCTHFTDGTPLTKVTDNTTLSTGGGYYYCAYDNDEGNV